MASDAAALIWCARLFLAIGVAMAIVCGSFAVQTARFISESEMAEGTVVDWTQGQGTAGRSSEPGAYYRVVEIVTRDGQRVRGETETGVGMNQLQLGERLAVRYRPGEPARMRVASFLDLWFVELITAILAIVFSAAGSFLLIQAKKEGGRS